jgi:hypothetical protein
MSVDRVRKEVGIHSGHSAQGAPIVRLRARFGLLAPLPSPLVVAECKRQEPEPARETAKTEKPSVIQASLFAPEKKGPYE